MSLLDADLEWTRVGDCYGVTKKPRDLDVSSMEGIPFAAMEAIPFGGSYQPKLVMKKPAEIRSGTYFERGDVLVAKITPSFENGKQALVLELPQTFGYATTEVIPLHPRNDKHDPRFLFFYLLHPDVRHHVAEKMEGSTGRQRVPENVLLDLPIPEIDQQTQKAMADVLEFLQQAAAAEVAAELATSDLKRSTTRALFTRGLRDEAQKDTTIGWVPETWEVLEFGRIRDWLQYGTSARSTYAKTEFPVLRIPNIEPGSVNTTNVKFGAPTSMEADRYRLRVGDLLFIRTNGVIERLGACAVYAGDPAGALFASYLIRARLDLSKVNPYFIAHFLGSERGTSLVAGRATPAADGKYNLNTATIDGLPIPLPPTLDEQAEIVAVLDAIDRKVALHRRKRVVLDKLLKAMLHKLITGEIRASDLDLSAIGTKHDVNVVAA